ncbi:LacI family transcriptional regulator [Hydrotalea sandarakina]|uniref:LacI family transcriptional regulator n=3 Tax=Hydrotalea TaxID=1004300 RepID=A0A2W7TER4_9BACT|nr:LacI family transcriptional regulator [Hydrotalea sandarakina]
MFKSYNIVCMKQDKEVTIYDIADYLNISAATVSRGLKDHPTINKKTKKKILEAAQKLGYRSNAFASNLRTKQSKTIGVIVPRLNSYFMSTVIAGIESIANEEGYQLIISQSQEDEQKEAANAITLFNSRVDGIMVSLAANTKTTDHFKPFLEKNIPIVYFDRVVETPDSLTISIDNYKAAFEVTQHLIDKGCKRILHLGGNVNRNVYADRLAGYKAALKQAGLPTPDNLVFFSNLSEDAGVEAANYINNLKQKPDAVFSANDTCAAYCMIRLKQLGYKIPGNFLFAGFNNDPISKVVEPNLTTIAYPGYPMGQIAATHLINHLKGIADISSTNSVLLRHELIVRASTQK